MLFNKQVHIEISTSPPKYGFFKWTNISNHITQILTLYQINLITHICNLTSDYTYNKKIQPHIRLHIKDTFPTSYKNDFITHIYRNEGGRV
jgi:hypothetical protein